MEHEPVHQISVPQAVRTRSTLVRVDYEDAFLMRMPSPRDRTAEQWARAILGDAPARTRHALVSGWSALGLKLARGRPDRQVLGWAVRRSAPDFVLLGADSRIGMPAELLFERRDDALLFATFVHHGNPGARATWAGVEPFHVPIVRRLLEEARGRLRP